MSEKPLNIVLIVTDQWRADCLGCDGNPVVQTPHLDMLFEGGVKFNRAYSAVPTCIAARASLLTGLSQRHHGRVGYQDGLAWNYPVTMASLLADAGYHTQAVGKMHVHPPRNLVGFHNVVLHDGPLPSRAGDIGLVDDYLPELRERFGPSANHFNTGLGWNGYVVAPWPYETQWHPSAWTTTKAIDFLRRRDTTKPFFLKVSYHRPHPPLDPPKEYLDIYRDVELPPLPQGDWKIPRDLGAGEIESPKRLSPAMIDTARRAYYAQITFIDHQINRLTMALGADGSLGETVILFVSDHGELLYDHGLYAKALPYEGSARVPLLMHFPRHMNMPVRKNVEAVVELRDLLPTICEIAGVPVPDTIDGKSLMPLIRDQASQVRPYLHGEHEYQWGHCSTQWLTDGLQKYIWYSLSGTEQLFDLVQDPQELHDIAASSPQDLARWRKILAAELEGREEEFVKNGQLVAGNMGKRWLSMLGPYPG